MKTATDRILIYLEYKGISKKQFYERAGLSNGFLDKTLNPGADKLDKILTTFPDINPYWLISGKGDMLVNTAPNIAPNIAPNEQNAGVSVIPKVITIDRTNRELVSMVPAKAAAGYLNGYGDPEYIERLPTIEVPGLKGGTHRAFEVRGNSMLPVHHPGSIAIGRWLEGLDEIRDRRVYILLTKQDGIVLKRVLNRIETDGSLILISDNDNKREYPNYPVDPADVLEVWYWRASIIRESPEPGSVYGRLNDLDGRLTLVEQRLKRV